MLKRGISVLSLQTPGARVIFFLIASLLIFIAPYDWLAHLSLWQRLGIDAPSIGLTRAYWNILHGDPVGAWQRNKLIYAVLVVGLPILARDAYHLWYNNKKLSTRSSVD